MPTPSVHVRSMLLPLAVVAIGAACAGVLGGVLLASGAGWSAADTMWRSAIAGGLVALASSLAAVALLWALSGPEGRGLTQGLLSMGMVRMLGVMGLGLGVAKGLPVDPRTFWTSVLAAALLALALETAVLSRFLQQTRRADLGTKPAP